MWITIKIFLIHKNDINREAVDGNGNVISVNNEEQTDENKDSEYKKVLIRRIGYSSFQ